MLSCESSVYVLCRSSKPPPLSSPFSSSRIFALVSLGESKSKGGNKTVALTLPLLVTQEDHETPDTVEEEEEEEVTLEVAMKESRAQAQVRTWFGLRITPCT